MEEKKREQYYMSQAEAEERKRELDKLKEEELMLKKQMEEDKQIQRYEVKVNNDRLMQQRIDAIRSKIEESEYKLKSQQERKSEELKIKHNTAVIKRMDRVENVKRISKVQDFERQKIMERIQADNERTERIK